MQRSSRLGRKTELKRGKPLERGTSELARTGPPERHTRIKPVSDKRKAGKADRRREVAAAFVRDGWTLVVVAGEEHWVGGRCIPKDRGMPGECFGKLTPHRLRKGSNQGGYTEDNVVASCAFHNGDIENRGNLAKALGLVVR